MQNLKFTELFTPEDIKTAIDYCNFDKSLGPDLFFGKMISKDEKVKGNFCNWAVEILNGKKPLPNYLRQGKLIPLSKTSQAEAELAQIRPVVVTSHISKILEKTILRKIEQTGSELLDVPDYQTGFKKGVSTQKNLANVLHNVLATSRTPAKREILLLFDLKRAFDSVSRPLLWQILDSRAKNENEKHIVRLISELQHKNLIYLDNKTSFTQNVGVL